MIYAGFMAKEIAPILGKLIAHKPGKLFFKAIVSFKF
ncbi:hypothetical protein UM146_15955 [Escherichia coli UM146]|nr:hypothetical protein UM146_15955 [Escherichia coli UM146]